MTVSVNWRFFIAGYFLFPQVTQWGWFSVWVGFSFGSSITTKTKKMKSLNSNRFAALPAILLGSVMLFSSCSKEILNTPDIDTGQTNGQTISSNSELNAPINSTGLTPLTLSPYWTLNGIANGGFNLSKARAITVTASIIGGDTSKIWGIGLYYPVDGVLYQSTVDNAKQSMNLTIGDR